MTFKYKSPPHILLGGSTPWPIPMPVHLKIATIRIKFNKNIPFSHCRYSATRKELGVTYSAWSNAWGTTASLVGCAGCQANEGTRPISQLCIRKDSASPQISPSRNIFRTVSSEDQSDMFETPRLTLECGHGWHRSYCGK